MNKIIISLLITIYPLTGNRINVFLYIVVHDQTILIDWF